MNEDIHDFAINIRRSHIPEINLSGYLVRIIFNTNAEQLNKLFVIDLRFISFQVMSLVIVFAIHLKHKHNLFFGNQEPFSIVQRNSAFNIHVNQNFLKV